MALIRCPKRIVRDGRLVAFAGEYMSEAEAKRRGILDEIKPAEETKQEVDFDDMTVAELHTFIEEHGGEASAKAKKAELVEIAKGL